MRPKCGVIYLFFSTFISLNLASVETGWENIFSTSSSGLPIQIFGNKSYLVVNYKLTFLKAMDFCENMHMNLVTIESEEEQKIVQKLITNENVHDYWTSGARILDEKNWLWLTTGDNISYSAWFPGEPSGGSEYCLSIQSKPDLKSWNDAPCDEEFPFICERPIDEKREDIFAGEEKDWQNILNVHEQTPNLDLLHVSGKHYYISHHYKGNYMEALDYCQVFGMKLATINSKEENNRLYRHIRDISAGSEFWTAGTKLLDGQKWVWLSNFQSITYTNWGPGKPDNINELCLNVYLDMNNGLFWNDNNCQAVLKIICEGNPSTLHENDRAEEFKNKLQQMTPGEVKTIVQSGRKFHVSRNLLVTASQARTFCSYHNMVLINIKNAEENALISQILPYPVGNKPFWTDGEKIDGKWVWKSSDTPINYFNWRQGSPQEEHCLALTEHAKYIDESCNSYRPFICEMENDGINHKTDNGDTIINVLTENNLITANGKVTRAKELVSSQNVKVDPNGGYHITVDNNAAKC